MKLNRFKMLELMEQAGFRTQTELAELVGVTPQAISLWMRGGTLTVERLGIICRALHCTPNDILVLDAPKVETPASLTLEPA